MAIKVGGTEVVDNNRQLKNIASVDATTVAALGTAGVGGGGGIFDMTATGAISTGDPLGLNSDGTVSKIGSVENFADPPSEIAATSAYNSASSGFEVTYDTAHDKFVVAFTQSGNAKVFAGTIGTNPANTPVIGSDATVLNKNTNKGPQMVYDSAGSGKHLMLWSYYETDADDGCKSVVVDVSGSGAPSVSSSTSWNDNYRSDGFSCCYDADNANVVVAYQSDDGNSYIRAGTVSSGTISWGTRIQFLSARVTPVVEYDPDSNQVMLLFSDSSSISRVIFYTVSGTTLTQLTEQNTNRLKDPGGSNQSTNRHFLRYDPHNNKMLISYVDATNGGLYIQAATIGSNSITYGTRVALDSTTSGYDGTTGSRGTKIALKDATSGTFYVSYKRNNPSDQIYIQTCTLSGTTITLQGSRYGHFPQNGDLVFDPDNEFLIRPYKQASSNTLKVQTVQVTTKSPAASSFIGFAGENISNAASGEVKLIGSVVTGLSGLTTGSDMYVTDSATFSTSSTNNTQVGRALSTSSLLITRPD